MRLTRRQWHLLGVLRRGAPDGGLLDMDQLIEAAGHDASRQAMQCSMKKLIGHGLVERKPNETRRGRIRAVYGLTLKGMHSLDPRSPDPDVISLSADED